MLLGCWTHYINGFWTKTSNNLSDTLFSLLEINIDIIVMQTRASRSKRQKSQRAATDGYNETSRKRQTMSPKGKREQLKKERQKMNPKGERERSSPAKKRKRVVPQGIVGKTMNFARTSNPRGIMLQTSRKQQKNRIKKTVKFSTQSYKHKEDYAKLFEALQKANVSDVIYPQQSLISYRGSSRQAISSGYAQPINFCDSNAYSSWKKIEDKDSASETAIYFATLKKPILKQSNFHGKTHLVIKEFSEKSVYENEYNENIKNGMTVKNAKFDAHQLATHWKKLISHEGYIYGVTNTLLERRNTPNIVMLIANAQCSKNHFRLVTEVGFYTGQGNALEKYPENVKLSCHILFPIIFTLACFAEIGLSHNDLHIGNVFVQEHNQPIPLIGYRIDKTTIVLLSNVKYLPLLYDFDRSCKLPTKYNMSKYLYPVISLSPEKSEHTASKIKQPGKRLAAKTNLNLFQKMSKYYNTPQDYFKDFFVLLCYLHMKTPDNELIKYFLNGVSLSTETKIVDGETEEIMYVHYPDGDTTELGWYCHPYGTGIRNPILKPRPPIKTPLEILLNDTDMKYFEKSGSLGLNPLVYLKLPEDELDKIMYLPHMYSLPSASKKMTIKDKPSDQELKTLFFFLSRREEKNQQYTSKKRKR